MTAYDDTSPPVEATRSRNTEGLLAENAALRAEIDRLHASLRMRLGEALVAATRPAGAVALPRRLTALARDAARQSAWRSLVSTLECGLPDDPLLIAPTPPRDQTRRAAGGRTVSNPSAQTAAHRATELKGIVAHGGPLVHAATAPRTASLREPRDASPVMVLHTVLPQRTNGYTRRSHDILRALTDEGRRVTALARGGGWRGAVVDGVRYERLPPLCGRGIPGSYEAYVRAYAAAIRQVAEAREAKLIHAASNHVTGQAAGLAARALGLPFLYELRGLWHVTRSSVEPEYAGSIGARAQEALEVETAAAADLVLVNGEAIAARLTAAGVDGRRIRLAPNGCRPPERSRPSPDEAAAIKASLGLPDAPLVGFVGSLTPYEGVQDILRASARLLGVPHGLLIAGDGPAAPALRTLAVQLGIADRCVFTGAVPPHRAATFSSLIDVAPLPRRDTAVGRLVPPLKPLEAMVHGAAIIVSDLPALRPFAEDDRGVIVRPERTDELAAAMKGLLTDPDARRRRAERGRVWAVTERSWTATASVIAGAYDEVSSM